MAKHSVSGESSFTSRSSLKSGGERFLSQVVEYAFEQRWRTPQDFLEHFKPLELMRGLDAAPELRGRILTKSVGFHERIARKKTAESAAEDLRIALEEGVTTPEDILSLITPDERVLYLDRERLFAFAIERSFFASVPLDSPAERAVDRMLFLLETSLGEKLITLADLADGVSFSTISQALPVDELRKVVESALKHGRAGEPLTEERLLHVVPLRTLVKHIPLQLFWTSVVLNRVALPAGFVQGSQVPPARTPRSTGNFAAEAERALSEPPPAESVRAKAPTPPPPPPSAKSISNEVATKPPSAPSSSENGKTEEEKVSEVPVPNEEDVARKRVLDKLAAIQRLPPRHAELSNQILFAIESMYAELAEAGSDDERRGSIHDSFPNEQLMATALLALIELLEPSVNVQDPEIARADIDSLINVFLIEERDARERGQRASAPPPPLPAVAVPSAAPGGRRSAPPPLPRPAPPPPLPGGKSS